MEYPDTGSVPTSLYQCPTVEMCDKQWNISQLPATKIVAQNCNNYVLVLFIPVQQLHNSKELVELGKFQCPKHDLLWASATRCTNMKHFIVVDLHNTKYCKLVIQNLLCYTEKSPTDKGPSRNIFVVKLYAFVCVKSFYIINCQ